MAVDSVNANAGVPRNTAQRNITIANAAALSGAVSIGGEALVGIQMPAAWTAADLTMQAAVDETTYNDVYQDDGTELTFQADASRWIAIDPKYTLGIQDFKLRSGTTATPVNQGAARTLILITRPV